MLLNADEFVITIQVFGLESINDNYPGFNLKMKLERKTAKEIVLSNWTVLLNADEFVVEWKVANELPSLVNDAIA